jgi:NAD(P)-dependent dehydrogenase (short-subunit alcohol dehydrogenase family)
MQIANAHAIVTGGASGLGAATARRLHAAGASVTIADLNEEKGSALASELGDRARFVGCDVSDEGSVKEAVDVAGADGNLRISVNCAGIGWAQRTAGKHGAHDLAPYEKVIAVNLIGTFNVLRLAAQKMIETVEPVDGERGVCINTASIAAFDGQIGQISYSASKGGVVGMTLPAARDLSREQIRVVTIAPGLFDTPLLAGLPEPSRQALGASVPHPARLGTPDEYGQLVESIVANPMLNGDTIRLDGALRMAPK